MTASKYCGSGLKIDIVVVVVIFVVVLVIKLLSNSSAFVILQGLKRANISYPMEKYFGAYEN